MGDGSGKLLKKFIMDGRKNCMDFIAVFPVTVVDTVIPFPYKSKWFLPMLGNGFYRCVSKHLISKLIGDSGYQHKVKSFLISHITIHLLYNKSGKMEIEFT